MNPKNFFGELKRRNVYKVVAAYAVVAWLISHPGHRDRFHYCIGRRLGDPFLGPLRGDPRFDAFVQKIFAPKTADDHIQEASP